MPEPDGDLPKVLVFVRAFPPVIEASGDARSVHAMAVQLKDRFQFWIVAGAGGDDPEGVVPDHWVEHQGFRAWYCTGGALGSIALLRTLRAQRFDLIYLNSFFDPCYSLLPVLLWRFGVLRGNRLVLAPRGEFSPGALRIKAAKKMRFLALVRRARSHSGIEWHASTELEREDILQNGPASTLATWVAEDLSEVELDEVTAPATSGVLRIVFLARIVPKKNLAGALQALRLCRCEIELTVAGPLEDPHYWRLCESLFSVMPPNVYCRYVGEVPHREVVGFLSEFDLLFLPTYGENFGHVILESLAAATPVLIGDETPWSAEVLGSAGHVLNPDDYEGYASFIDRLAALPEHDRMTARSTARSVAARQLACSGASATVTMLRGVR